MQWLRKFREVEWIASLIDMVWGLGKRAWKYIASAGGVSMSGIMGWLPEWLMVILAAIAGVYLFTLVESLVKKKVRERNKKESQQKKSNLEKPGEMSNSAVVQVRSAKDERDRYKAESEANEKAEELTKLRSRFKDFKKQHGLWRIQTCGREDSPIGLSVSVQFIEPRDSGLAERILGFFISVRPIFKTNDIKPVTWFRNPSSNSRIVIFSNHPNAGGIKAAFKGNYILDIPKEV